MSCPEDAMRVSFKTLMAAALLFGGAAAIQPSPAVAQTDRDYYAPYARQRAAQEFRSRAYGPRFDGRRSYRPRYYDRGYYGRRAYRPAYYGRRYYSGYPYRYYYRRGYDGGAAVAGLIGGLALGTIAGAVTSPFYYGTSYYRPAYYAPRCVLERRRVVRRDGRRVWRRVQVCY
jgi:hypothetical protein